MIIDIHGHIAAPVGLYHWKTNLLAGRGYGGSTSAKLSDESLRASAAELIATFDSVGTDMQIVSPKPFQLMHSEKPAKIVRYWVAENNDIIARQVKMFPDRIVGMAGLPQIAGEPPSTYLDDLDHAVNELGMVGCILNPDPYEGDGGFTPPLGDEYWYPLYEKLVELDVPALIHSASCKSGRESYSSHFITEEGIGIVSLANSTVFEDFPTLKLIAGHGGGPVPYQIGRWRADRQRGGKARETFDESLRHLYFDTVLYNKESIELLLKICGTDRCMFGTEKPGFGSAKDPVTSEWMDDLKPVIESIDWLSADDRAAIFEGNARSVFRQLAPIGVAG